MNRVMDAFTELPLFGLVLTLGVYATAVTVYKRWRTQLLNPLVVTAIVIMGVLVSGNVSVGSYQKGADIITFWLGPAAVALAVPLYRQMKAWRRALPVLIISCLVGCAAGLLVAPLIALVLGVDHALVRALVPRSVTTPIAVELAKVLAAIPEITAALVIASGVLGHVFGPRLLTAIGVRNPLARGLAVGVAAHGIGTARMLAESEQEGAASGAGMSLAGLFTGIIVGVLATVLPLLATYR